ncbi:helix-turn-helix transcriptional regulator [Jiulongibacter sediminis]|nr:WYL domain-containing protein [Jiulongibacter sediminis]
MYLDTNDIRLLYLLMTGTKRTKEISDFLEVDKRSVPRLLDKLRNLGYNIDSERRKGHTLLWDQQYSLKKFNTEESRFLAELVQIYAPEHPLAKGVMRKLDYDISTVPLAKHVQEVVNSKNFENLKWALKHQCQVILKPYHSNNELSPPTDRTVLPLQLYLRHRQLYAYELESGKSKTYKLSRIGFVEVTNEKFNGSLPPLEKPDPFGFYATTADHIHLSMTKAAAQLLAEEYPEAEVYLSPDDDLGIKYKGPMCNPMGIGRFILGLPGKIKVRSNQKLMDFLHQQQLEDLHSDE